MCCRPRSREEAAVFRGNAAAVQLVTRPSWRRGYAPAATDLQGAVAVEGPAREDNGHSYIRAQGRCGVTAGIGLIIPAAITHAKVARHLTGANK